MKQTRVDVIDATWVEIPTDAQELATIAPQRPIRINPPQSDHSAELEAMRREMAQLREELKRVAYQAPQAEAMQSNPQPQLCNRSGGDETYHSSGILWEHILNGQTSGDAGC